MAELKGTDFLLRGIDSGRQIEGRLKPTSELQMHLALYRARPDIAAVFHTHSPFASGVMSAGIDFKPMFARGHQRPRRPRLRPLYHDLHPRTRRGRRHRGPNNDTVFMKNHGVVALGKTMKQAFFRCCVAEDAAKSFVAASVAGTPRLPHG
jgi:L-fuculose-phosphate aldolase